MDHKHKETTSSTTAATAPAEVKESGDLLKEAADCGEVLSVGDMLLEWGRRTLMGSDSLDYKMYIVVNNDLKMGKGKMCAQVGHVVAAWTRRLEKAPNDAYQKWLRFLEPKIVLKGNLTILTALRQKYPHQTEIVIDAGKTQVAPGSLTVLAFQPMHINNAPPELASLELL